MGALPNGHEREWRVNLTTYRLLSSHSWLENGPSQDVFSIENRDVSLAMLVLKN